MASRQWLLVGLELLPQIWCFWLGNLNIHQISQQSSRICYTISVLRSYFRKKPLRPADGHSRVGRCWPGPRWDRPMQPGNLETAFRSGDRCKRHGSSNSIQCLGRMDQQVRMVVVVGSSFWLAPRRSIIGSVATQNQYCRGSRGDFRGDFRSEAVHAVLHVLLQQGVSSTDRSTW